MEFRNYIPPNGGHVGCGMWQSRSLIRDSGSKGDKWTKERLCGEEYAIVETSRNKLASICKLTEQFPVITFKCQFIEHRLNPIRLGGVLRGPDGQTHSCQSETSYPMMLKLGDF